MAPLQVPLPECAKMAASVNNFRFTALQWPWWRQRGCAINWEARERGRKKKALPLYSNFNMQKCFIHRRRRFSFFDVWYAFITQKQWAFFRFFFWLWVIQTWFSRSSSKTISASFYVAQCNWVQTFASVNGPRRAVAHCIVDPTSSQAHTAASPPFSSLTCDLCSSVYAFSKRWAS